MKNRRLDPWGSAMILSGIIIAAAAFFVALWQDHPDPSSFKPGELGGIRLRIFHGTRGFECEETGEFLPVSEIPLDSAREEDYEKFVEERVFEKGGLNLRVAYVLAGGLLLSAAGAGRCSIRRA